ncbi:MAG TPA: hypothetical protein VG206_02900 [Terriglobia bacterium]|nr:hypothetical protein [Terriglobia bacterium]
MRLAAILSVVILAAACSAPQPAQGPVAGGRVSGKIAPVAQTASRKPTAPLLAPSPRPPAHNFQQQCKAKGYWCFTAEIFPNQPYDPAVDGAYYVALMKAERWMAAAEKVHLTANPPVFVVVTGYGAIEAEAESKVVTNW